MSPVIFDFNNATAAEKLAEIERRNRNRAAGRAPTDDGPTQLSTPHHAVHEFRGRQVGKSERARIDMITEHHLDALTKTVRLVLPWSCLVPDNAKYAAGLRAGGAFILLSSEYRTAKNRAVEKVEEQMRALGAVRFPPKMPLQIEARMYEPNRHKRRDVSNYAKLVHDALTGIVYADDSQLDRVVWIRAGVDVDAPRLELAIGALV